MPEDMPDRMPEDMPDRMPEGMSDRMPEDVPVTKCINVMVGITRSKVFFFTTSRMVMIARNNWETVGSLGMDFVGMVEFIRGWKHHLKSRLSSCLV